MKLIKNIAITAALLLLTPAAFAYNFFIINESGTTISNGYDSIDNGSFSEDSFYYYDEDDSNEEDLKLYRSDDGRTCAFTVHKDPKKNDGYSLTGSASCKVTSGGRIFTFGKK